MSHVQVSSVCNLIDLDTLQGELDSARGQVNMWVAQRELAMKEAVAAHKTAMATAEGAYVELVEKEKDMNYTAEELARRKEWEQAELDALREEAHQARELGQGLPKQLQTLRDRVYNERIDIQRVADTLSVQRTRNLQHLRVHHSSVELYIRRLGLRFDIGCEEELRFYLSCIDPVNHKREFLVAVRVTDSGSYELMNCDPGIEISFLLEECNRTNDLSLFVRGVRKAFRKLVSAGGTHTLPFAD